MITNQNQIEKSLKELNFSENEAKTYLTILEFNSLSPYELSEKTGLNRSYLYDLLNNMLEKGYINKILVKNKNQFQATDPKAILELFKLKINKFQKIIPELNNIKPTQESFVELHKGKNILKTLIKNVLTTLKINSELNIISADEKMFEEIEPTILKQYFRQLNEKNIKERVIIKKDSYQIKNQNIKYFEINPELIGNTSTFIYEDKVAELIFGNPNFMTITTNKELTETKKKLFEYLWNKKNY